MEQAQFYILFDPRLMKLLRTLLAPAADADR
jgi:hypothetical protein